MGKVTGFRDFVDDLEQYCSEPEVTQWLALSTTLMLFVIVIILLSNLHKLRRRAAAGDFEAATELLLPVYWWLVVGFAMTYVLDGLYVAVWGVEGGGSVCGSTVLSDCTLQSLLVGFELGCRRCVIDGVTVFFMHAGAGKRSVRRTAACMVPWGLFVWFVEFLWQQRPVQPGSVYEYDDGDDITTADDDDDSHENGNPLSLGFWRAHNTAPLYRDLSLGLEFTYVIGVFLCYAALAVLPPHVLYRRPALGSMYYFWQTLSMFLLLLDMVAVTWLGFKRAYCVDYIGFTFLQVALGPFVLYNTLRDDSKYWQGLLDLPSEANSVSYSQSTQPSNSSSGHGYPFSSSYSSSSSYAPPPFLSSRATVSTGAAEPSTQQSQLQRRAMSATPHSSSSSSSSSTGGGGGVGGARVTGGWFSSFRASTGGLSPYLFGHGAGTTDHGQRSQHGTQTNNGGARRLHHGFEEAGHPPHDPSSSSSSSPSSSPQFPSLASPALSVRQPMVGQQLMEEAAHELAHTMDLLSASPNVAFLHFGLLSIDATLEHDHPSAYVLGAGGAAKVYRGRLRGEPVAIKMIWSVDITAEIVSAFREEVMMLARLARHPNVVQVKGFSVMPPALCVVMELCNKGSLLDLLKDFRDAAIAAENADQTRKAKQQQKRQRKQQRQQKTQASSSSFRWAQLTSQMRGGASLDTAARAIRDEDYDDDGAAEDGGCQGRATAAAAAADSDEEIDARVNGEDDKKNVGESRENSPAVKEKEEEEEEKKNEEKAVKIKKRRGSADDLLESPPSSSPRAHSCEEQATHFSVESRKDRSSTGSSSGTVTSRASLATVTSESSESVPHSGDSASSVGIAQGSAYRASLLASWPVRLKLARECAEALAFLHLQTPRPVMHKDVKSANFMVLELEPDPSHVAALRTEHRKKELNRRRKQAQQRNGGGGGSSGNAKAKKSDGGGPCPLPPPRYEIRLGDLGSAVESLVVEGQEKKKKKAQRNDRGGGGGGGDDDDDDDSIDSVVIRGSSLEALPRPQSLPFDNGDAVVVVADAGVGNGEEDEEEKHEQDRGCDGRFGCGAYDSGCSSLLPDHHPTTSPDESQHSSSQSGSRNGLNQQHRRPRPRSRPRSHSRNKNTSGGEGTASMTASGGGGSLIVGNTGGGAKRSSSAHRLVASRKHQHSTTHASFFATTITAAAAAGLESPPHEEDEDEDDDEEGVEGGLRVSESESRRHSMGSAFASLLRTGKKSAPATTPSSRPRGGSLESSSSSSPLSTTPAPWNHRSKVMDGSGASGGSGKSSGGSGSGPNQEGHSGYSSQLLPPPAYSSVQEQGCASESFSDRSLYDDQLRYVLNDNVTPQWAAPEVLASILTVTKKKKKNHARERDEEADGCGEFGAGAVTSFEDKYTTASDVYSLGVVLWEIWTCQVPFEEYPSLMELVHRVGRNGETPSLASCAEAPTRYRNLLRACWHKDPAKRPSALKVAETLRVIQMKLEAEEKEERERDAEVARVKAAEEEGKARDAGGGLTEEEWGDEAGGFLGDENESRPQAEATWWGGF